MSHQHTTTINNKPCVLIIYTGGTIGMVKNTATNTLAPASTSLTDVLDTFPEFHTDEIPLFDIIVWPQLYDSSDMTPTQYIQLCNNIADNYDKYTGFVILHGTDTLSYTASVLSFMLENLGKPVILTGSMIPLSNSISDAKRNLLISLLSCVSYPAINDVCIYFNNQLIRGNRSHKVNPNNIDAFESMNQPCLATMGVSIQLNHEVLLPHKLQRYSFGIYTKLYDVGNIIVIYYTPGLNTNLIKSLFLQSTAEQPVVLVLSLFGSGNAPSINNTLISMLKYGINECNVEVVVCSQCTTGCVDMCQYATGYQIHELGCICAIDMTIECIVGKLMYLLGKGYRKQKLKYYMESNIRGELTSQKGYGDHTLIHGNDCIPESNNNIMNGMECP